MSEDEIATDGLDSEDEDQEMMLDEDKLSWIDLTPDLDRPWRELGYTDAEVMIRGGYFRPLTEREIRDNRRAGTRINNDGVKEGWIVVPLGLVDKSMAGVRSAKEIRKLEPMEIVQRDETVTAVEQSIQDVADLRNQFHRIRVFDEEVVDEEHHQNKNKRKEHVWLDGAAAFHKYHPALRIYAIAAKEYKECDDPKIRLQYMKTLVDLGSKIQMMIDTKTNKAAEIMLKLYMAGVKKKDRDKPVDDPDNMSDAALLELVESINKKGN